MNEYGIYFDSFYTPNIDDLKQYMSSFNLRQQFKDDILSSTGLTKELVESIRSGRNNASYNVMQYKYSPLKPSTSIPNTFPIDIVIENNTIKKVKDGGRTCNPEDLDIYKTDKNFIEDDREVEWAKAVAYEAENPKGYMFQKIDDVMTGEVIARDKDGKPVNEANAPKNEVRRAFWGEFDLECRFITSDSTLFEDFMFLYNTTFYKKNPKFNVYLEDLNSEIYARTSYSEISMAEQINYQQNGNLMAVGFTVNINTLILSSFVKTIEKVKSVGVYTEARLAIAPALPDK